MRFAIVLLLCAVLTGCGTTYYQVKDPSSGSTYYTTEIDKERGGAVSLKDHLTNAQVTVQDSEVMEITGDQYDAAIRTTPAPAENPKTDEATPQN